MKENCEWMKLDFKNWFMHLILMIRAKGLSSFGIEFNFKREFQAVRSYGFWIFSFYFLKTLIILNYDKVSNILFWKSKIKPLVLIQKNN